MYNRISCGILLSLIFILLLPLSASAWETSVDKVHDGDTIEVTRKGREVDIRFYGIDCPESDQPYGIEAKLIFNSVFFNIH